MKTLRRRLGWKLFVSYLIVILVGVAVLASSAAITIPNSLDRHMGGMMGSGMMMGPGMEMDAALAQGFRAAFNETLAVATATAVLAAAAASVFIARQVVAPVRAMREASRRIAEGRFDERVPVRQPANQADELDQLAHSFNRMAARLEETESRRRQLIGDVAHELRTPLTTIKGSLEGLLDGVLPPEPGTYESMHREAARLQRLVDDLQQLSRVESGAVSLIMQPVSIPGLLEGLARRMEVQFSDKGVGLRLDTPDGLPDALGDPDRLTQVLTNLLGNALQYTPAGGAVTAAVREASQADLKALFPDLAVEGRRLLVSVSDTGVGIEAAHLPLVFDRFYRVDRSRSRAGGGSGIGLTIAKSLVEAHRGRIRADSGGPGRGSRFTFCLPAA